MTDHIHIQLSETASATVSPDIQPETIEALKNLVKRAEEMVYTESHKKTVQYLKNRIAHLRKVHDNYLTDLDHLTSQFERQMHWKIINELHSRYTELEEVLKVMQGGESMYGMVSEDDTEKVLTRKSPINRYSAPVQLGTVCSADYLKEHIGMLNKENPGCQMLAISPGSPFDFFPEMVEKTLIFSARPALPEIDLTIKSPSHSKYIHSDNNPAKRKRWKR